MGGDRVETDCPDGGVLRPRKGRKALSTYYGLEGTIQEVRREPIGGS